MEADLLWLFFFLWQRQVVFLIELPCRIAFNIYQRSMSHLLSPYGSDDFLEVLRVDSISVSFQGCISRTGLFLEKERDGWRITSDPKRPSVTILTGRFYESLAECLTAIHYAAPHY